MDPSTESTSINDLPNEMISELFEYLPLKGLVACSLVDKRWHSIYAAFKLHRLAATDVDFRFFKWYDTTEPILEVARCPPRMFLHLIEKPLLSNLRYLALCGYGFQLDLNELNRFQQLIQLEIDHSSSDAKVHLNLPRLKVLVFHYWNNNCPLSIDCPELRTLVCREDVDRLEVKQPETIRKLETRMSGAKLVPFKSVKCLVTPAFETISRTTLQSLPSLRELHFNGRIERVLAIESIHGLGALDRVKQTLKEFLDEAKKLSSSDFQFTFSGFRLTKVNVDRIDFGVQVQEIPGLPAGEERVSEEYVYMKNYHLIEPGAIDFVRVVEYTRLRNVTGEFPRCFSQKFTSIDNVIARAKVQDEDQFLCLLKSLKFLSILELANAALSQDFYDQLPASVPSLNSLHLRDDYCDNGLQLNFDFIGRIRCLLHLTITTLPLRSLPSLVRSLGPKVRVADFYIQLSKDYYWITKKGSSLHCRTWVGS